MNAIPILFLSLIAVASSHVLRTTTVSSVQQRCAAATPEQHCLSAKLRRDCNSRELCMKYLLTPVCERGPAFYCKESKLIKHCNKQAYCLTWPDDSVVAISLKPTK